MLFAVDDQGGRAFDLGLLHAGFEMRHQRIDLRRIGQIKDRDEVVGNRVKATVVKNKVAPPFRKTEFDILFGKGISKSGEIIDMGVEQGIIKKSGSWFAYEDNKLGQGRDAVRQLLEDNPELCEELEKKIKDGLREAAPQNA